MSSESGKHFLIAPDLDEYLRLIADTHKEHAGVGIEMEAERLRNLNSLAAGAVVVSLTLGQLLLKPGVPVLEGRWLLAGSWVFFALSILMHLTANEQAQWLRIYGWRLFSRRGEIITALQSVPAEHRAEHIYQHVSEIINSLDADSQKYVTGYKWRVRLGGISFFVGLVLLVAFGIANLF